VLDGLADVLRRMETRSRRGAHRQPRISWRVRLQLGADPRARHVGRAVSDRKNGIEPTRLSAAGYAEYRPMVPNDTEDHRMQNRRMTSWC